MYLATKTSYPSGVLRPVPTAVPPKATSDKCSNVFLNAFKPWFNCATYPEIS